MMRLLSYRHAWLHAAWLSFLFLLLLSPGPSRSQTGIETMDLKALEQQAEQLEARVNKNAADYATLRELAVVYHYMALKDSKAYAKKAVQRLDDIQQADFGWIDAQREAAGRSLAGLQQALPRQLLQDLRQKVGRNALLLGNVLDHRVLAFRNLSQVHEGANRVFSRP